MESSDFVHLHVHSHFSLLDGLATPEQLIERAKELGMEALAITDHGAMYGAIEFYKAAKKAGIKPIIGVEIYVAPRSLKDKVSKLDSNPYHLTLFAKNSEGYRNLMKIVSIAHLEGYYYRPRIDKPTLKKYAKGLIGCSACLAGEIPRQIISKDEAAAKRAIGEYIDIFGRDDFYLELQDHPELPEQAVVNKKLKELAKEFKLELIASCDVHYARKDDKEAHDVLVCVQTGKTVEDPTRMIYEGDYSLQDPKQIMAAFKDVPEALLNTKKIAQKCNLEIEFGENLLPQYPLPKGKKEDDYLRELSVEGIKKRFPKASQEELKAIHERLEFELKTIFHMGFSSYFLIVADFVNWAKGQNILVGPGRGSAAGSLVSYLINITDIDPIAYGLLFERFLNPDRIEMPDIDMDFADHRRAEVLQYVAKEYGEERVAGIITFGTMAARAAIRDVGRALGLPYAEVDAIAKVVPPPLQGKHIPLERSVKGQVELKEIYERDPKAKRLLEMAMKLEGTVRHASQHASAFVIGRDDLTNYVPLQTAQKEGIRQITQYSMYPVAELGLLKMDFLGLSNLTTIERALEIIEAVHHDKIDIHNLPLDDRKTFQLLAKAETTGVFQLECLSGETIVSNTTIKKLYERRNKKVLESVYLDEGKVHKNKIISVLKSGKKKVFNLIAENGWFIKATAEHRFLTGDGWKKLKEIRPGDKVLLKSRAKHLVFKQCLTCGKQLDGQKGGRSRFCHRCAALHYRNPSKDYSRKSISAARLRYYQQGGAPWNKGETKETSPVLSATGKKISQALMGRSFEDLYGTEKARIMREKMRREMTGERNHMFGKRSPHRKGGFRDDLGHYVRSNWEADFARILIYLGLQYQYEPETFPITLPDGLPANYTPDFYVPSEDKYFEIKGWMHDLDRAKLDAFSRKYPDINLEIISATKFAEFALKYRSFVKWECPMIPAESFGFMVVKEIRPAGTEETYDIAMEEPGNNFVANGFVVHNSSGMKRYIKELKPTTLDDIAVMVALYRPGPLQFIDTFIRRKNGKEKVSFPHPVTENALKVTYGIPVYQEQVMQIAKDMAGFSGGEADTLRKAMGKKIAKLMAEMKFKFIGGAIKKGVPERKAQEVFAMLEDFAAYGFNKSHAVSYAMIAYQTAYLKANYPECFMAALLTSDLDDIDRIGIEIEECERLGLEVLPPDVNESFVDFGVVKESGNIRFGLGAIKNIGTNPAKIIVRERKKNGPYKSFEDFIDRMSKTDVEGAGDPARSAAHGDAGGRTILNKKILEALAKSGALDSMAERAQVLGGMEIILKRVQGTSKQIKTSQIGLFGEVLAADIELGKLELPQVEPASKAERLAWEKQLLGIYLSEHPLREIGEALRYVSTHRLGQLDEVGEGRKVKIAGLVTALKKINTRSGQPMLFVGLEDLTGKTEVLVFPKLLESTIELWQPDSLVIVEGKISTKDNEIKVLADKAEKFEPDKIDREHLVTVGTDEDAIVEIDLSEEPEADELAEELNSAVADGKLTLEKEDIYYVVLPRGTNKEKLLELKEIFAMSEGDLPLILAHKKDGEYKFVKTRVKVKASVKLESEMKKALE